MVEAFDRVGGPPKLVRTIMESSLAREYEFHVVSYLIAGFSPGTVFNLRNRLLELGPDIVHVHGLKNDGFQAVLAARLACVPRVLVTVHGSSADAANEYPTLPSRLRRWAVARILEPAALRLSDAVYCVCEAMERNPRIRKYSGGKLLGTIHNGVELLPPRPESHGLRASLGLGGRDVVLIYTGRIAVDKGLDVLASAMEMIVAEVPAGIKLVLVGDGPGFAGLRSRFLHLIESGYVIMTGRRDDVDDLNAMADIFVFPSLHENLPFSLLEAMNAGIPVVATAVGGVPEIVESGRTGFLVPPANARALAGCILRLHADDRARHRMGAAGRERLSCCFSAGEATRKTGDVYRSLLASEERCPKIRL